MNQVAASAVDKVKFGIGDLVVTNYQLQARIEQLESALNDATAKLKKQEADPSADTQGSPE